PYWATRRAMSRASSPSSRREPAAGRTRSVARTAPGTGAPSATSPAVSAGAASAGAASPSRATPSPQGARRRGASFDREGRFHEARTGAVPDEEAMGRHLAFVHGRHQVGQLVGRPSLSAHRHAGGVFGAEVGAAVEV